MTRTVAVNEFLFTIKRPAFLILTFGMPILMLAYAGFVTLVTMLAAGPALSSLAQPLGVVDETGLLAMAEQRPATNPESTDRDTRKLKLPKELQGIEKRLEAIEKAVDTPVKQFASQDEAVNALRKGEVSRFVQIPLEYTSDGLLRVYVKEWKMLTEKAQTIGVANRLGLALMRRAGMSETEIERTRQPPDEEVFEMEGDSGFRQVDTLSRMLAIGVPFAIGLLLFISVMINAGFLAAGIAEEKENKVIEVLLSSVRAEHLLMGKVIGLGAAALVQITIWLTMAGVVPALMVLGLGRPLGVSISPIDLMLAGSFYLVGFFFYGSLLVGLGSLGNTVKESQQYTVMVLLLPIVPMVSAFAMLDSPNGLLARTLSYVPLFSPPTMMFRLGTGRVPLWDTALAMLLLVLGTWLAVILAARLFRAGTLMYGKPPSPFAVIRLMFRKN